MENGKLNLSRDDFLAAVDELAATEAPSGNADFARQAATIDEKTVAALYGERIRSAREWKGFTLDEVSLKTGIDKPLLERVEGGDALLPLGLLIRVVKTLSLRLADVISRGQEPFTVVRSDERKSFQRIENKETGSYGYEYESLAPKKKGKTMEPFVVTLYPMENLEPSSHEGQEFLYVLEGEIEVSLEGRRTVLGKGDAIYYDSQDTHLVEAHGGKPARIVAVLSS
jgi:quercetin dioxygenase-like cupin family protein